MGNMIPILPMLPIIPIAPTHPRRSGFCPTCDYDLTGNTTDRCPE